MNTQRTRLLGIATVHGKLRRSFTFPTPNQGRLDIFWGLKVKTRNYIEAFILNLNINYIILNVLPKFLKVS
jgi:hypothetical protein